MSDSIKNGSLEYLSNRLDDCGWINVTPSLFGNKMMVFGVILRLIPADRNVPRRGVPTDKYAYSKYRIMDFPGGMNQSQRWNCLRYKGRHSQHASSHPQSTKFGLGTEGRSCKDK